MTALSSRSLSIVVLVSLMVGCAGRKDAVFQNEFRDAAVVYQEAMTLIYARNLTKAKRLLEGIQYTRENRTELEPLVRLRLADVSFYSGNNLSLIDARSMYLNFVTLYTDHDQAPYAQMQAGIASLLQANHPTRDQSESLQAIFDLRQVQVQFPDSPFSVAANDRINEAESTLAEHDFIVGQFYLKRGAYGAAFARFQNILETYPRYNHREKLLFHLGKALVLDEKNDEGRIYLDRVQREFPAGEFDKECQSLLARIDKAEA